MISKISEEPVKVELSSGFEERVWRGGRGLAVLDVLMGGVVSQVFRIVVLYFLKFVRVVTSTWLGNRERFLGERRRRRWGMKIMEPRWAHPQVTDHPEAPQQNDKGHQRICGVYKRRLFKRVLLLDTSGETRIFPFSERCHKGMPRN
jgi:hypothetical protein